MKESYKTLRDLYTVKHVIGALKISRDVWTNWTGGRTKPTAKQQATIKRLASMRYNIYDTRDKSFIRARPCASFPILIAAIGNMEERDKADGCYVRGRYQPRVVNN